MIFMELAQRNIKEICRDPLSIGIAGILPIGLFVVLGSLGGMAGEASILQPTMLAPGVALFGFSMVTFGSAFLLARDRENSLLARMLTTPLRPVDFIAAYALPYFLLAMFQVVMIFGIGAFLGLRIAGNAGLVFLILATISLCYVGVGLILGSLMTSKQVGFGYTVVLLPTIFSGTWFELDFVGEGFRRAMNVLPFTHALGAVRGVMGRGADLATIAPDLLFVVGYSLLFLAIGVVFFGRRMAELKRRTCLPISVCLDCKKNPPPPNLMPGSCVFELSPRFTRPERPP
jgi:ABC-2 type transport system permease protein